jgi:tetratricopeptide (TPR) repeat protein
MHLAVFTTVASTDRGGAAPMCVRVAMTALCAIALATAARPPSAHALTASIPDSSARGATAPHVSQAPPAPPAQAKTPAEQLAEAQARAARLQAELAFVRAATQAVAHGKRAEAEALARARGEGDPAAAALRARLAADRGRLDEAVALVQLPGAADPAGDAALEWGLVLWQQGRKAEARRALSPVAGSVRGASTPDALLRVARAARALGQSRTANALFREAAAAAPKDPTLTPAVNTAWGQLFLDAHDPANATASFRAALALDGDWAPAHAGLARSLTDENPPAAMAAARRAVAIDPALVDAHLFLAEAAIDADKPSDAREALKRALAANPHSPDAHALAAAIAYVDDRMADYESAMAKALATNPGYGDAYRIVAMHAARHYRYDDAVVLVRRAIALEPDNMRAQADLGLHLLRVGDERGARRALETAFRADPYDLVTFNLLQMLDTLDGFSSFEAGGVTVRLDPDDAPVLSYYALPMVRDAMAKMRERYGFAPQGPILVEVFPKHDDFAVRTLGLPGLIGALGACFGRVVTLDSPRPGNRPPGSFNWQATLWHEMAHVFTMQLSKYRVPRWLTEGISVYEEGLVRPEWARDSELGFARAYASGKVLTLAELNSGFTRPDTIELAYFQASLVVALIVRQHGHAALNVMLRAYGDGVDTEAALHKATGKGSAELQSAFDTMLTQRYSAVGKALQIPDGVEIPRGAPVATLKGLAAKYRDSYPVQVSAGQALAAAGAPADAIAAFERAAALVPTATGPASPRAQIAALAERAGDFARALRELTSLVADDHTNIDAARKLIPLGRRLGDQEALILAYERIVTVDPFDAGAHAAYGRMAADRRDLPLALREFRAAIAAGPVDPVPVQCDLGEALLAAGQRAEAKQAVLAALEIAPTYERAQQLLLRIVEGK